MAAKFACLTTRTARGASLERSGQGWVLAEGCRQEFSAAPLKTITKGIDCASETPNGAAHSKDSVTETTRPVAETIRSATESVDPVTDSIASVTQTIHSDLDSVDSTIDLTVSVADSIDSVRDSTTSATDLTESAALLTSFGRAKKTSALPIPLSVPDTKTSATEKPRSQERGITTPARVP